MKKRGGGKILREEDMVITGKIKKGVNKQPTLYQLTRQDVIDLFPMIIDFLRADKKDLYGTNYDIKEEELKEVHESIKESLKGFRRIQNKDIQEELGLFVAYVVESIRKDFRLLKKDYIDEDGHIKIPKNIVERLDSTYMAMKLRTFYSEDKWKEKNDRF